MINLTISINGTEIPEIEHPKKIVKIVEKILDFTKKQKGKGIKILTLKQMLQRLPIALAQVKAHNTSGYVIHLDKSYILCIERKKLLRKYTTI